VQDTVSWIARSAEHTRANRDKFMGGATQAVLQAIADHTAARSQANEGTGFALPGTAATATPRQEEAAEK
jgi:hypothetical protein